MGQIEIRKDGVYLDGSKFFLVSGDFHYFRTHEDGWRRRLKLMKDFGLTAVTTYVAWNLHEPKPGEYCFEGIADLPRFLREADEEGLKVVLRLSPYMCAEWEMGGLPSWLLRDRTICLRSSDEAFMKPVRRYTKVLADKIRPYLYTNGGPVILLGLENEYGSFGNDKQYLLGMRELYRSLGLDVPFISANGADPFKYINGTLPDVWNGVDATAVLPGGVSELEKLRQYQPNLPLMAGEAWCGKIFFWGSPSELGTGGIEHAAYFEKALEMGAFVNFYMFCGGTNFAFFSGALINDEKRRYRPLLTSYDYDAPVSEDGVPQQKYFLMRDVLDKYLGKEPREHIAPPHKVQTISDIRLDESAMLFDNMETACEKHVYSHRTICMEDLEQDYGFISYTTQVEYTDPAPRHLRLDGLADRATVYLDGQYIGSYMRDREDPDIVFTVPEGGATLRILVENVGRVNYGYRVYDYKGILGSVRYDIERGGGFLYNFASAMGFDIHTFPMKDLSRVRYEPRAIRENQPVFLRGHFKAEPGVDTFLDTKGFSRGFVKINGFNIGKFWHIGPQRTLYVPGELLKEENTIEIFDVDNENVPETISCIDHALLQEKVNHDHKFVNFELL